MTKYHDYTQPVCRCRCGVVQRDCRPWYTWGQSAAWFHLTAPRSSQDHRSTTSMGYGLGWPKAPPRSRWGVEIPHGNGQFLEVCRSIVEYSDRAVWVLQKRIDQSRWCLECQLVGPTNMYQAGTTAQQLQVPVSRNCAGRVSSDLDRDRPTVTFPAVRHHCASTGTKLYRLVTAARECEQVGRTRAVISRPRRISW